jgi:hypothetical protein
LNIQLYTTWFTIGHFFCCLFSCKTRNNFACTVFWQTVSGRIVVKYPDMDVLVLLVHYFPKMKNTSELWFQTGFCLVIQFCGAYGLFITFLFTENTISPIRSGSNTIWTYNCTLLDLLLGTSFVVFFRAKHVIFCPMYHLWM